MKLEAIVMDREVARTKLEEYEAEMAAKRWRLSNVWKQDWDEVTKIYKALATGAHFIDASSAITKAGRNRSGQPSLAIMKATRKRCYHKVAEDGLSSFFASKPGFHTMDDWFFPQRVYAVPVPSGVISARISMAIVPMIPPKHLPQRSLYGLAILWEAEWNNSVPTDPVLLQPVVGISLCRVLAQWDLTSIERIALQARL